MKSHQINAHTFSWYTCTDQEGQKENLICDASKMFYQNFHPGTGATKIRTDSLCWNRLSDLFLQYMKLMSSWLTWFFMTFPILFFYYIGCVCDVKETTDGYHREADQSLWGFEGVSTLGVNYRWCFKVIFVKIYLYYLYSYIFFNATSLCWKSI